MKTNNLIKLGFLLPVLSGMLIVAVAQSSGSTQTIVIKTNIYCDHCLDCNDCGGKLVHDLSFEKGIKKHTLDPKEMTITITYNATKTTPEKLREAIAKLGYDADEVKADSTAYSKLDGCCKKK